MSHGGRAGLRRAAAVALFVILLPACFGGPGRGATPSGFTPSPAAAPPGVRYVPPVAAFQLTECCLVVSRDQLTVSTSAQYVIVTFGLTKATAKCDRTSLQLFVRAETAIQGDATLAAYPAFPRDPTRYVEPQPHGGLTLIDNRPRADAVALSTMAAWITWDVSDLARLWRSGSAFPNGRTIDPAQAMAIEIRPPGQGAVDTGGEVSWQVSGMNAAHAPRLRFAGCPRPAG